jgi:hypothetical protein
MVVASIRLQGQTFCFLRQLEGSDVQMEFGIKLGRCAELFIFSIMSKIICFINVEDQLEQ